MKLRVLGHSSSVSRSRADGSNGDGVSGCTRRGETHTRPRGRGGLEEEGGARARLLDVRLVAGLAHDGLNLALVRLLRSSARALQVTESPLASFGLGRNAQNSP
eukprot:1425799-Pleurochrysis_carterae.AAC.1